MVVSRLDLKILVKTLTKNFSKENRICMYHNHSGRLFSCTKPIQRLYFILSFEIFNNFLDLMIRRAFHEAEYERFMSGIDATYTRASFVDALEGWSEESLDQVFSFSGSGDDSLSSFTDWLENIDDIENLLK